LDLSLLNMWMSFAVENMSIDDVDMHKIAMCAVIIGEVSASY